MVLPIQSGLWTRNGGGSFLGFTWSGFFVAFSITVAAVWVVGTVMLWLIESRYEDNITLLDVIKRQIKFISELRLW